MCVWCVVCVYGVCVRGVWCVCVWCVCVCGVCGVCVCVVCGVCVRGVCGLCVVCMCVVCGVCVCVSPHTEKQIAGSRETSNIWKILVVKSTSAARFWDPLYLLFCAYRGSFPGLKRPGRDVKH